MKKYTSVIIVSLVALSIVAAPFTTFAKEKEGNNKDRGCARAWGHLFAPGWVKHNPNYGIGDDCNLPFGIGKKFHGNNASTTPDVTAPVLSSIISLTAKYQAEIRWTTDERSDSTVFISTTSPVVTNSARNITKTDLVRDHRLVIKNLNASTTYYIVVRSRDAAGNTSTSSMTSFTTKPPSLDNSAPVISNVVTLASTSTIQVGWKTNEPATGRVYYSITLPVVISASTTQIADTSVLSTNHVLTVSGLNPSTTYYLIAESTDNVGNVSTSATFAATTGATTTSPDVTPPVVTSAIVTVGSSTASVTWTTSELASSKVFYATTTPVNTAATTTAVITDLTLTTNHTVNISGLATSTLYHFVIQSADSSLNTTTSSEIATSTLAI